MTRRSDLTRTDLGLVAAVLADLDHLSMYAAAKKHHVDASTVRRWRARRAELGGTWPTPQEVAAQRTYLAQTAEQRRRTQRRNALGHYRMVPALGAVRRIQALLAMGYRFSDLATEMGVSVSRVHQLAHYFRWQRQVNIETDQAIRALYRRLCARPAPRRSEAMMARHARVAQRNGWAPPLAWATDAALDDPDAQPNLRWVREVPAA